MDTGDAAGDVMFGLNQMLLPQLCPMEPDFTWCANRQVPSPALCRTVPSPALCRTVQFRAQVSLNAAAIDAAAQIWQLIVAAAALSRSSTYSEESESSQTVSAYTTSQPAHRIYLAVPSSSVSVQYLSGGGAQMVYTQFTGRSPAHFRNDPSICCWLLKFALQQRA